LAIGGATSCNDFCTHGSKKERNGATFGKFTKLPKNFGVYLVKFDLLWLQKLNVQKYALPVPGWVKYFKGCF